MIYHLALFMPKFRLRRVVMVPNFIGIVPVSLFHAKSRTARLVRRVSATGSRPERLLWSSLSEVRQLSPPTASGIAPAVVNRHQSAGTRHGLYARGT